MQLIFAFIFIFRPLYYSAESLHGNRKPNSGLNVAAKCWLDTFNCFTNMCGIIFVHIFARRVLCVSCKWNDQTFRKALNLNLCNCIKCSYRCYYSYYFYDYYYCCDLLSHTIMCNIHLWPVNCASVCAYKSTM